MLQQNFTRGKVSWMIVILMRSSVLKEFPFLYHTKHQMRTYM